jgi:hypothetical protein
MGSRRIVRAALPVVVLATVSACQVYLSGTPAVPVAAVPGRLSAAPGQSAVGARPAPPGRPAGEVSTWDGAPAAGGGPRDAAPGVAAAAPAVAMTRPPLPTYPGERYFAAAGPRVLVDLARGILAAADYEVVRAGASSAGGEVAARRRERVDRLPPTTSSVAWQERAALIRVTGSDARDCCYVQATFTITDLNASGNLLAISPPADPRVEDARAWFYDEVAQRLSASPVP